MGYCRIHDSVSPLPPYCLVPPNASPDSKASLNFSIPQGSEQSDSLVAQAWPPLEIGTTAKMSLCSKIKFNPSATKTSWALAGSGVAEQPGTIARVSNLGPQHISFSTSQLGDFQHLSLR